MCASKHGATDMSSLASLWGPRLVRFYFYVCADQALAESFAIETLAAVIRSRRLQRSADVIVRLAVEKSIALPHNGANLDRIAQALASLPARQRIAVALFRGMGVGVDQLAKAMATSGSESKRLLTDGLLELHRLLVKEQDVKLENISES